LTAKRAHAVRADASKLGRAGAFRAGPREGNSAHETFQAFFYIFFDLFFLSPISNSNFLI
jgi:hypothetical protein